MSSLATHATMTKRDFRHLHERLSRLEDAIGIDDDRFPYPSPLLLEPTSSDDYGVRITLVGQGNRSSETVALTDPIDNHVTHPNRTDGEYRTIDDVRIEGDLTAPVDVKLAQGVLKGDIVDVIEP